MDEQIHQHDFVDPEGLEPHLESSDLELIRIQVPRAGLISGIALISCFVVVVISDNTPMALAQPVWLINLLVSIVDNAFYALVGLLMIGIAAAAGQGDPVILAVFRRLTRLAVAASLAFLLLIPLLLLATRQSQFTLFTAKAQRIELARARLDSFRIRVANARSTREIEALLKSEQGISLSSEDRNRPVDALRQGLLARLDEARRQLPNTRVAKLSWQWSAVQRSTRISLMAIAYAISFGALARRKNATGSLLTELHDGLRRTRLAWSLKLQNQSAGRRSRQAFRDEIRLVRSDQELRHLQDQRDRAMAAAFEASETQNPSGNAEDGNVHESDPPSTSN